MVGIQVIFFFTFLISCFCYQGSMMSQKKKKGLKGQFWNVTPKDLCVKSGSRSRKVVLAYDSAQEPVRVVQLPEIWTKQEGR